MRRRATYRDQSDIRPRRRTLAAWSVLLAALVALASAASAIASPPDGFAETTFAEVASPTAFAFLPSAEMLVTSKGGQLSVVPALGGPPTMALDLSDRICANAERGLLGVAVDLDFADTRHIFLFYTAKKRRAQCPEESPQAPVNRVSRFELREDLKVAPNTEMVLLNNMPSYGGNHNGGDLQFGPDGHLYVAIGDSGCRLGSRDDCQYENTNARRLNLLAGKILRITTDGTIPDENPFQGAKTARCNQTGRTKAGTTCREIYATGLRNPFRIAFERDGAQRLFINDVGGQAWEEINQGEPRADYGWNEREGRCRAGSVRRCSDTAPKAFTNPVFAYRHGGQCCSITGGAFVPAAAGWPSNYGGAYLFGDFVCDAIFELRDDAAIGCNQPVFASDVGAVVHLAFGPDGNGGEALYYATFAEGGQVKKIEYTD